MGKLRYTVVGPHSTLGHAPGESFDYTLTTSDEAYYFNAGHLALAKDSPPPEPIKCGYCAEHGTAAEKKATFDDLEALQAHYREEHPALEPPTTLEEVDSGEASD